MTKFTTPLIVEHLADGKNFRVHEPFKFWFMWPLEAAPEDQQKVELEVHENFITDFASIPRPLWWLYNPTGPYGKAAVIHDYIYRNVFLLRPDGKRYTKHEADLIFKIGMSVLPVSKLTNTLMYYAVDLCGYSTFDSYRNFQYAHLCPMDKVVRRDNVYEDQRDAELTVKYIVGDQLSFEEVPGFYLRSSYKKVKRHENIINIKERSKRGQL